MIGHSRRINGAKRRTGPRAVGTITGGVDATPELGRWPTPPAYRAVTGFETFISASTAITNAGTFSGRVRILAAAPTGTYNIYVSLEGGAIATQQVQVAHTTGNIDTRTFIKAGVPNGANRFVVTATGAVAPPSPPAAPGNINVHISYVFGKEAFGVTELAGLQTFLTPPTPSDSDPAVQRRKASWKQIFKAVIKNVDFYRRIETASNFN